MRSVALIPVHGATLAMALAAGMAPGCASDPAPTASPGPAIRPAGPIGSTVASENGLEVRKLVMQDEDGAIGRMLLERGDLYAGEGAARLKRNGYLLVRVDAAELDALVSALGSPLTDLRTWHGQAPAWRDLVRVPARTPVAAIVDGRPRVFEDGSLRLLLRAWTLPTEDGAVLELQLRAHFQPVARGAKLVVDPTGEDERGERVGGSTELHLGLDEAWILTCALPRDEAPPSDDSDVRRDGLPARAATDDAAKRSDRSEAASTATPRERAGARGPVPDDIFGPGASLPPTLGALLLSTEIPATRTLFVLLPKLPDVAQPERPELDPASADSFIDPSGQPPMGQPPMGQQPAAPPAISTGAGEASLRGGER